MIGPLVKGTRRTRAEGAGRSLERLMGGVVNFGEADDNSAAVKIDRKSSHTSF